MKTQLLCLMICLQGSVMAIDLKPEIQGGILFNYSNFQSYNKREGFYVQAGSNINKTICISLNGSWFNGNNYNYVYPRITTADITGGSANGKNDTFYNVRFQTKYKVSQYLLKVRINLLSKSAFQLFIQPAIGLTKMQETKQFEPGILPKTIYSGLFPRAQLGAGFSLPIDKDKKISLCTELSFSASLTENSIIQYQNNINNIDIPYFTQLSVGLKYRFY